MAHWSDRQLFYTRNPDLTMMVVDVTAGPDGNPVLGEPRNLFKANPAGRFNWDVAPEGNRFIMPVSQSPADLAAFNVVLDWTAAFAD